MEYLPKTTKQIETWFKTKKRNGKIESMEIDTFKNWYKTTDKTCKYCGLTEIESQKIVKKGLLKSKRFPQGGIHGRGTSRGMWLEIDRYDPSGKYEIGNIVLACYFCNNDKSDVFHGDDYKLFLKERLGFLKSFLLLALFIILHSCSLIDSEIVSEKEAKEIIAKELENESGDIVEIVSLTKTNGVKQEFGGQKFYLMDFKIELSFKENANQYFINRESLHFYSDKDLKEKLKDNYMQTKSDFDHYKKGETIEYESQHLFEKKENGWEY